MTGVDLRYLLKTCRDQLLLQGVRIALLSGLQVEERGLKLKGGGRRMGQGACGSENDLRSGVFSLFAEVLKGRQALGVGFGVENLRIKKPGGRIWNARRLQSPACQLGGYSLPVTSGASQYPEIGMGVDAQRCQSGCKCVRRRLDRAYREGFFASS